MKRMIEYIKRTSNTEHIKSRLSNYHDYDLSLILLGLDEDNRKKLYSIFDDAKLASIISYLDDDDACDILGEFNDKKIASIINEMEPDDATDVLMETTKDSKNRILKLLSSDMQKEVKELASYNEYSAGAFMTTHFISVCDNQDIKVAMKNLISNAPDVESINTIFVVDKDRYLKGVITLKDLIITKSPCLVDDIMNTNFKSVNIETDIEEATKMIKDYDILDLPVLDNGIMKGIITMDDAIDNIVEEASEDYARFSGLTTNQEKDESFFESVKKRIPWLIILLIFDLFVPIISSSFDFILTKGGLVILVAFQPLVLGLSGNSAMQTLGITIRSITNKTLDESKEVKKHILKELSLGVLLGLSLGIITSGLTYLMLLMNKINDVNLFKVALTVGFSTSLSLLIANTIASLVPIIFYRLKKDPAVASGPFITTIVDVISVLIYFVLATIILYNTL